MVRTEHWLRMEAQETKSSDRTPRHVARRLGVLAFASLLLLLRAPTAPAQEEPSFDKLVELNAEALFGAPISRKDDRFTAIYEDEGRFERGFECRARGRGQIVSALGELKNQAFRKVLVEGSKGKFGFVGIQSGSADSRFDVLDDWTLSFRLRVPTLPPAARISWGQAGEGRDKVELHLFPEAAAVGADRSVTKSASKKHQGPTTSWFDAKHPGVPMEIRRQGGKWTVRVGTGDGSKEQEDMVEVLAMEGADAPSSGRLSLQFSGVSFLVSDLRLEGKFPRAWAEAEIERLRRSGSLRTEPPAEAAHGADAAATDTKVRLRKRTDPDLSKPDPEIDEKL